MRLRADVAADNDIFDADLLGEVAQQGIDGMISWNFRIRRGCFEE